MEDFKKKFSFLRLFNTIKGVGKPLPLDQYNLNWLKEKADKETKDRYARFDKWCKKNGVVHPKIKYPVMFGKGDNGYLGALATDDIGPNETIIKVPSHMIINTKVCY
jgi:hypothetical protein